MKPFNSKQILTVVAISGNVLLVLWMLSNGLDEGFKATLPQLVSYLGLTALLALNTILLFKK